LLCATTIVNGVVTGAKIASGTITGTNISSGTITGGLIAAATITGTNIAAATVANANLVNSSTTVNGQSCALGGSCTVTSPSFNAPQRSTSLANTSISSNTQTIVITESVTFPSASGTYRADVRYGLWMTIGPNVCNAEVIDTTNSRAFALSGQDANGSGFIGLSASEISTQTYAASATATFTLQVNCNANTTVTTGAGTNALSPAENTYLSVTPVLSN